jgi:pilus assembly protein CpaB
MTLARGNRGLLIIALLAGLIAAVLVFAALAQSDEGGTTTATTGGPTVTTIVATQDIDAGTTIKAEMVEPAEVPENLQVTGAFSETTPVVGETTRIAIAKGEAITPAKVGSRFEGGEGIGGVLADGQRGIALRVEEVTSVGGNLLPGDRVDVIAVFEVEGTTPKKVIAKTVLQNVEVISVAQEGQTPLPAGQRDADGDGVADVATSGQLPEDVKEQPGAATLTLALDPTEAQLLALVQETAVKVYTSLRPFGDQADAGVPSVELESLLNE